ncbi:TonB-dependent receptor, partial [Aquabacterium sp.]|uniref:TonB-dependent receptor n=1 Tax=Aquabacterium sp. TaxID=1872578 RepID=UPI002B638730
GDPVVGVSVDGIFFGRPQMAGAALYDLERVELLRGPQGTLYGRNSTAGAINIITRKPGKRFEGSASLGLSSYSGRQGDVMLNVPVSESFALRGVLSTVKRDGYVDTAHAPQNNFTQDKSDQDNVSGRLQGRLTLGADTTLAVSADMSRDRGVGPGAVSYAVVQANPRGAAGRYVATSKYEGRNDIDAGGFSAELRHKFAFAELTALAGHRTQERDLLYSVAGAAAGAYNHASFSQDSAELRLASADAGPLQWVAGVYAFREEGSPIVLQAFGPSVMFYQDPMKTDSKAIFGQATYALAPSLRLTGGLRQTQDAKSRQGCSYSFAMLNAAGLTQLTNNNDPLSAPPDAASLPPCPTASINNVPTTEWNKLTYRLGVDHDLDANTMVFATYSTGFKAGGFNDGNLPAVANPTAIVYNPETLAALEFGLKTRLLKNTLQLNVSAYRYAYTNLQVSSLTTCASGTGTCTLTTNAGKARSSGLELEGRYLLTPVDRINFGLGLTNAKYTQFTTSGGFDWSGRKLDKAPASMLNLGWSHQFALANGAALTTYIGTRHSAKYVLSNPAANLQFEQAAYTRTDAHLTYASADDRWDLQLYVRNIEDRNVATSYQFSGGQHGVFLSEPRIVGLRGNFKF